MGLDYVRDLEGTTAEEVADLEAALVEAGAETAGVRLSASLQRVAANVSVASVLSSYFADNVTPLMAAVRAPAIILCALLPCIHAWPGLR